MTTQVQAGGGGIYTVGGVPATVGASENDSNCAGWTLAVVYQNFSLPVRDLTLFVGSENAGAPAASVSGFCTPPTGALSGRLAVSALEGDATGSGDTMLFGPTSSLGSSNRLEGPNNKKTNFFASQINRDDGTLDTSGTFGTRNQDAQSNKNISGGRQGWDVTNVDVSSQLQNNQTQAFAQGTTSNEQYTITALGLQINVGAPIFSQQKSVDKPQTFVGDTLTYTIVLANGGTIAATNVVFTDPPPPGTTFVAGSFSVDGVAQPAANPAAGVNLGSVPGGASRTVRFQVRVTSVPASPAPAQYGNAASSTYQYVSCAGQPTQSGSFTTNTVTTGVPRIEARKVPRVTTAIPGEPQAYSVTISNTGTAAATEVTLTDAIPPGTTYQPGTTTLNDVALADVGGMMPFAQQGGRQVNSPGEPSGQIGPSESAIVFFQVLVDPAATGSITNSAQIDPDGPGILPAILATAATPVAPQADLTVSKDGPDRVTAGSQLVFTSTVVNQGPSNAINVMLSDPIPSGLSFVSNSGDCTTVFPCSFGTLVRGATRTVTTTFLVPAGYTTPDPIVNQIAVSATRPTR